MEKKPSSMSKLLKLFNAANVKELCDLGEFIHFSLKIRQDLLNTSIYTLEKMCATR